METAVSTQNGASTEVAKKKPTQFDVTKSFMQKDDVKKKFEELLGKRAQGFITSVLQIVSNNDLLKTADHQSIYQAAATAATLDLPLNNNLGFAYVVPYKTKDIDEQGREYFKNVAQFQLGYRGFIQLAQRSGLFKTISVSQIFEGQLIEENPLTGFVFDFKKKTSDKVIGYAAYFELLNGFQKTLYVTVEEAKKHGKRYSQTYKKGFGLWETDFDAMAMKTILKLLLSKYAPLSIEMQRATISDQSIINNVDTMDVTYVDNTPELILVKSQEQHEAERVEVMIKEAKTLAELEELRQFVTEENTELFADRLSEIKEMRIEQGRNIKGVKGGTAE